MKAVVAVLLVREAPPASLAAGGVVLGLVLFLDLTGWLDRLGRLVPKSVLVGLELGLGLTLGRVSLDLMAQAPTLAFATLALLADLLLAPRLPAALTALVAAILFGQAGGPPALEAPPMGGPTMPSLVAPPTTGKIDQGLTRFVLLSRVDDPARLIRTTGSEPLYDGANSMHVPQSNVGARLTDLVRQAKGGGEVVLTRHGRPAARTVPLAPVPT